MITTKMLENAHKIAFIVENYPGHKLTDVMKLLQMPAIDINSALWAAQELKYIEEPNADTGEMTLAAPPETYELGDNIAELQGALVFCFEQLAKKERDLEETYLSQWVGGYSTQDVLIAMKDLLNKNVLAEYEIDDPQLDSKGKPEIDKDTKEPIINQYTFYTLYDNREQLWGTKEFKTNPVTGEKNVE